MSGQGFKKQGADTLRQMRETAIEHHRCGDLDAARDLYRTYLERTPDDADIWSNLGALFRSSKKYDLAATCQRRALLLDSQSESILNNAANAFFDAGDLEDALALRRRVLDLSPNKAENLALVGKYLRGLGRYAEAERVLSDALDDYPDDAELHIQLAFATLAQGNYARGFKHFHWRWFGDEISRPKYDFPQWDGQNLSGKKILVVPEQGFGDTILMARFLAPLKQRGGEVLLICKPPLKRILSAVEGVEWMVETRADIARCDYWTPIMDLPRYLGADPGNLPPPARLKVPTDAQVSARAITAPFQEHFKIGVMWSGSVTYRANHKRSVSHREFLPLANIPGVQMFSLYKGPLTGGFNDDGSSCLIIDAAGNDRDFADSAALIEQLDLVVTTDSAIAHVAGSLGVEVWNLLHSEPYWLYAPFEGHTPWYPSMRLIRQRKANRWGPVFDVLYDEITMRAGQKTGA